jgi:UDP-2-acetamido-2,6-beta-L-arabino-hexul-4-ose reductase
MSEKITVLVTGAAGFIGKNLTATLSCIPSISVTTFDVLNDPEELPGLIGGADFIFHLAGVNRPEYVEEYTIGNADLTRTITYILMDQGKKIPLILSSSIQAEIDNQYGYSKREAEDAVFNYGRRTGAPVYVYRLPNVFGKWCRPNYNSVVATFCHNIVNELPIQVKDPAVVMQLVYIDDVINDFLATMKNGKSCDADMFCRVQPVHTIALGEIADLICSFRESRVDFSIPDLADPFTKKLYSTYLSYLPENKFSYPLKMNQDERGSFTEFIRTVDRGQVSVNITKPGVTKGNHWHHTKNEKFLVVSGQGRVCFRKVGCSEVIRYDVSGERLEVVDIPTGYTHSITNSGGNDLVTVMWCNELYNPEIPDTFFEVVILRS